MRVTTMATAIALLTLLMTPAAQAEESMSACRTPERDGFENVQIETSDIALHEQLFEQVFRAAVVQRLDHPQTDAIRIYCLRGVAIVIRQDFRTPRPTGWVQVNFIVPDVAGIQRELESAVSASSLARLPDAEREKIVRFRRKPDVMRGHHKVDRLEVYGPEGFLVGFDQPKQQP